MNVKFEIDLDIDAGETLINAELSQEHSKLINAVMDTVVNGRLNNSKITVDDGDLCMTARIDV